MIDDSTKEAVESAIEALKAEKGDAALEDVDVFIRTVALTKAMFPEFSPPKDVMEEMAGIFAVGIVFAEKLARQGYVKKEQASETRLAIMRETVAALAKQGVVFSHVGLPDKALAGYGVDPEDGSAVQTVDELLQVVGLLDAETEEQAA